MFRILDASDVDQWSVHDGLFLRYNAAHDRFEGSAPEDAILAGVTLTPTDSARNVVVAQNSGTTPLTLQGAVGQIQDLAILKDSNGGSLVRLTARGDIFASGGLTVSGSLTAFGPMTARGGLTVAGGLTVSGAFTAAAGVNVWGSLNAYATAVVSGALTVAGALNPWGAVNAYSTMVVSGGFTAAASVNAWGKLTANSLAVVSGNLTVAATFNAWGRSICYERLGVGGTTNPQGILAVNASAAAAVFDTPQTYLCCHWADNPANRAIQLQMILNASFVSNYIMLNGTVSGTVAAPNLTSQLASSFGIESTDASLSLITAAAGVGIAPIRALTISNVGAVQVSGALTAAAALRVWGPLTAQSTLTVSGAFTVGSGLQVWGGLNLLNNLDVAGTVTASGQITAGSRLQVWGAATFLNTLNLAGTATLSGQVTTADGLQTWGPATFLNTLTASGQVTAGGALQVWGPLTAKSLGLVSGAVTFAATSQHWGKSTFLNDQVTSGAVAVAGSSQLWGPATVLSTLEVSGQITGVDQLQVWGAGSFLNTLTTAGNFTAQVAAVASGALTVVGSSNLWGPVNAYASLTTSGQFTAAGNMQVWGAANLLNNLGVSGNLGVGGQLTAQGSATLPCRFVADDASNNTRGFPLSMRHTLQGATGAIGIGAGLFFEAVSSNNPALVHSLGSCGADALENINGTQIGRFFIRAAVVGVNTDLAYFSNRDIRLCLQTPSGTVTRGALNLGSGGFDGGANHFSGNPLGTLLAGNAAPNFRGDLLHLQTSGSTGIKTDWSGNTTIGGALTGSGRVTLAGALQVWGAADILNNLTVSGSTGLGGGATIYGGLQVSSAIACSGRLTVGGALFASGAVSAAAAVDVWGPLTALSTAMVSGQLTSAGAIQVWGAGSFLNNLDVVGAGVVSGQLTGAGAFQLWGSAALLNNLAVSGLMAVGGTLTVQAAVVASGALTAAGALQVWGAATILNNLGVSGNLACSQQLTAHGSATFPCRFVADDASNNTRGFPLVIRHTVQGATGAIGIGAGIFFEAVSSNSPTLVHSLGSFGADALQNVNGTQYGRFFIRAAVNGTNTDLAYLSSQDIRLGLQSPSGTVTRGIFNIGNGGFDAGAGHFSGSPLGALIAGNTLAGFGGDLINLQTSGGIKHRIDSLGHHYAGGYAVAAVSGAAAGTSQTPGPVVTAGSVDTRGNITFGSGVAPTAGAVVVVTFSAAYAVAPVVMLVPKNSATAGLAPLYISAVSATGFTVSCQNAPTASQANTTYSFDWLVLG